MGQILHSAIIIEMIRFAGGVLSYRVEGIKNDKKNCVIISVGCSGLNITRIKSKASKLLVFGIVTISLYESKLH